MPEQRKKPETPRDWALERVRLNCECGMEVSRDLRHGEAVRWGYLFRAIKELADALGEEVSCPKKTT